MGDVSLSLNDIIKKSKVQVTMRGRGRSNMNRGARSNGSIRGRGPKIITDARFKIIQKNRAKLTDARDKLAEMAKQTDARLKLDKIRASQITKNVTQQSIVSRKNHRNGRLSLSTNKMMSSPPLTRTVGYRPSAESYITDMNMDYSNDYLLDSTSLRRTVNNEYAPTLPPPPPVFSLKPSSPYTWIKPSNPTRSASIHQVEIERERERERDRARDFKVVAHQSLVRSRSPYKQDWNFGTKSRTILTEDYDSRSHRDIGVKSRLDAMQNKSRSMGVLSRPKVPPTPTSPTTGYRIVVSNLQANVTQEDIKELFEDVGELLVSRLVRPGTAEVIYKTLKDATKAVETYHNRQLDGHPMKCLLVNPRPKNNPTGPAVRSMDSRRSTSSSYVQPSLGAVHRALFDDS